MQLTTDTIRVGDIDIACSVLGTGTPVFVVHGAIALGSTYMRALDTWSDELRLVQYDQRGSGHTPLGDPTKFSMAGGVEDLDGLRQALGFERITVLGHSAGAYLAGLYAATHPESTAAAVLLNPGPPLAPPLMAEFGMTMASRRTPEDEEERSAIESSDDFKAGHPEALERHQLNTFAPFFDDPHTRARTSLGFTEITAANVREAPQRMVGSLGSLDPMAKLASITCPTLVVHAEHDPIPVEWSQVLARTIPGADFALVEGANHFAMIEAPARLRDAVVPWIRSTARTAGRD